MLAVSARDGNADTQRPMVIGEPLDGRPRRLKLPRKSMECRSDVRALDVAMSSFK